MKCQRCGCLIRKTLARHMLGRRHRAALASETAETKRRFKFGILKA